MNRMKFQRRQSRRLQRETNNELKLIRAFMKGPDLSIGKIEMEIARKIYLKMQEGLKSMKELDLNW